LYVIRMQVPPNMTMFGNNIGGKEVVMPLGNHANLADAEEKAARIAVRYAEKIDQRPTLVYSVEERG